MSRPATHYADWLGATSMLCLALCDCSNDAADLYAKRPIDSGAGATAPEPEPPPPLPALPDEARRTACIDCAERECGTHREACLESPTCMQTLAHKGTCKDPNCMVRWDMTLPQSLAYDDYFACVFGTETSRCPGDCGAGDNWECVDRGYRWDRAADPSSLVLELETEIVQSTPALTSGWEVASCRDTNLLDSPDGDGCIGWVPADGYGRAELRFADLRTSYLSAHAMGGVLGARHVVAKRERLRLYGAPAARSGVLRSEAVSVNHLAVALVNRPGFDPALGVVAFEQVDCLGARAVAVVELSDFPENQPRYGYDASFTPSPSGGFFTNLPPSPELVVTSTKAGRLVSKRVVAVMPPSVTEVRLWPLDALAADR